MKFLKYIIFSLLSFIITLFLIELLLGYTKIIQPSKIKFGKKRIINLRENPRLTNGYFIKDKKQYPFRTDKHGFIKQSIIHANPDLTIVFLGGSTTECRFVQEEKRFPYLTGRLLEKHLTKKVNAINSGISGNSTIHSINILLNKIPPLKPDYVVLMHNINDLNLLLYENSYWNTNPSKRLITHYFAQNKCITLTKRIIPNIYFALKKLLWPLVKPDEFSSNRQQKIHYNQNSILKQFHDNLELFIAFCKIKGYIPILMTQASQIKKNPVTDVIKEIKTMQIPYQEYKKLFDSFNEQIRITARKHKLLCIDLAKTIPPTKDFFYDIIHLNNKGLQKCATIITNHFHLTNKTAYLKESKNKLN